MNVENRVKKKLGEGKLAVGGCVFSYENRGWPKEVVTGDYLRPGLFLHLLLRNSKAPARPPPSAVYSA